MAEIETGGQEWVRIIMSVSYFVEIGAGFMSTDGKGRIDVILDSIPVNWDGRITLFPLGSIYKDIKNG